MMRILFHGAESILYLEYWLGKLVLVKERYRKRYRLEEIDQYIRRYRTINEAKNMIRARLLGVKVPIVYDVDVVNCKIRMQYIEGITLKNLTDKEGLSDKVLNFYEIFGQYLGKLHLNGIIHGDPTVTNILIKDNTAYMIDFGLSEYVLEYSVKNPRILEKIAIDVNIVLRVIESAYSQYKEQLFQAFLNGYLSIIDEKDVKIILNRVDKIRKMARYQVR